ncbi:MAG: site-specific DNA-methyltransferase [bacterium]|nr:site-specific DNA-methyltransferase [bacterium]
MDVLRSLPDGHAQTCVTSPPYWGLRDYGVDGQMGLEATPDEYVAGMVEVFREVRRVLRDDGTLWLNLGDSYNGVGRGDKANGLQVAARTKQRTAAGLKPKDLCGIPWRVAFALQADGWYLRSDIIWHKPNPMPESITDRPTKAHEYVFLMSKSPRYHYDHEAIADDAIHAGRVLDYTGDQKANSAHEDLQRTLPRGRVIEVAAKKNKRTVWTVASKPFPGAHFAVFPPKLIEPCIKAGAKTGDVVLDPFTGAGTTAVVAKDLGCRFVGAELNTEYIDIAAKRLRQGVLPFGP